jgi:NAD(P)-dependent dehydrogenase (short-subunit alcohol dehydrogenase family)
VSRANPVDYSGRAVLVTGGTRGIGLVIAQTFLAAGAQVAVCARAAPETAVTADDRTAAFFAADLRDPAQARPVVESAAARFGRLDVVINNAGGTPNADAATVSPRFIERIVALNLLAPFYVSQPANAVMQDQSDGGTIINIGSVSAHNPMPGSAAYSAAKAGLLQLTRSLALEWAPKVRVNHITTGLIRTESAVEHYGADGGASVARTVPMQRLAVPADVADACLYLGSSLAAYVTGADLQVHGGGEIPARFLAAQDASDPS